MSLFDCQSRPRPREENKLPPVLGNAVQGANSHRRPADSLQPKAQRAQGATNFVVEEKKQESARVQVFVDRRAPEPPLPLRLGNADHPEQAVPVLFGVQRGQEEDWVAHRQDQKRKSQRRAKLDGEGRQNRETVAAEIQCLFHFADQRSRVGRRKFKFPEIPESAANCIFIPHQVLLSENR